MHQGSAAGMIPRGDRLRLLAYFPLLVGIAVLALWHDAATPYWLDEVFSGGVSCQSSFAAMMPLITHDIHPVFYHVLVHMLFDAAGCHLWLVRLVSGLASLGGVALLLRSTHRHGGNAFLLAALTLGNPGFWIYATEARAYGLLFLAGSGVVSLGLSGRPRDQFVAIGFALLGGLLHYFASFLFAVLLAIALIAHRPPIRSRSFWMAFAAAGAILTAYYGLQIENALAVGAGVRRVVRPDLGVIFILTPVSLFGNLPSAIAVIAMALAAGIARVSAPNPHARRAGALLIAVFLCFALFMFGTPYFGSVFVYRYMHFLAPALMLGLSLWVSVVARALGEPGRSSGIGKSRERADFRCSGLQHIVPDPRCIRATDGMGLELAGGDGHHVVHQGQTMRLRSGCAQCGFVHSRPISCRG